MCALATPGFEFPNEPLIILVLVPPILPGISFPLYTRPRVVPAQMEPSCLSLGTMSHQPTLEVVPLDTTRAMLINHGQISISK
jgi:hypothetical protein